MESPEAQKILVPAIAIITAAIIAGIFGLVGHWTSRSNAKLAADISRRNAELAASLEAAKVLAGYRQEWITALREDMVIFLRLSSRLGEEEENYAEMAHVASRILMRMNNADPDYGPLVKALVACIGADGAEDFNQISRDYREISQRVLKREWEVLKSELTSMK